MAWRDHQDRPTDRPDPPQLADPARDAAIGDFQGPSYRRNAFAQGTDAEVGVLRRRLRLAAGQLVLDVGCGDARHLRALAEHGIVGVGVDVSAGLLRAGAEAASRDGARGAVRLVQGDARRLPVRPGSVDAALSLNQGAFGTDPRSDRIIMRQLTVAVRPGGRIALTAFHALFAARHLVPGDAFDPVRQLHHQVAEVHGPEGERRRFDLWTSAYTARELRDMAVGCGLTGVRVTGCEPGRYDGDDVGLDDPELLLTATRG